MDMHEIKVLLAVHVGNEELVLKNAGGNKMADSNDYFVVTDDGTCHLFDASGTEKDISAITTLFEDTVSKDTKKIVIPNSVTSIEERAFSGCEGLTSVVIPDSVTNIGEYVFLGCSGLTSVTIPDSVESIVRYAFAWCCSLTNVMIGNGVMTIGDSAFSECRSLTSVVIPDGVVVIGDYAFFNCSKLTSVTIPDSVTDIGRLAFRKCDGLKSLVFKGKTLEEVKDMDNYPFGIQVESVIKCIDEMHTAA